MKSKAISLLRHYFRWTVEAAGRTWTYDNDAEIEQLVDCLIKAAVEEMKKQ